MDPMPVTVRWWRRAVPLVAVAALLVLASPGAGS
jgi:hypothetical protein